MEQKDSAYNKGKKVLIVEDEPFLLKMYELGFRKAGYRVVGHDRGSGTLELVKKELPDVILLDIVLPEMSGFDILKDLKGDAATAKIPVIVLSNLGQESDIEKGKRLGADAYFIKANLTVKEAVEKLDEFFSKSKQ